MNDVSSAVVFILAAAAIPATVASVATAVATASISCNYFFLLMLQLPLLLLLYPAICFAADAFAGDNVAFEANSATSFVVVVDATAAFALVAVAAAAT